MPRRCACACYCTREIARREEMQSVTRCATCRKSPGPDCGRRKAESVPVLNRRVLEPWVPGQRETPDKKEVIEIKLAMLAAKRKRERSQTGWRGVLQW